MGRLGVAEALGSRGSSGKFAVLPNESTAVGF